MATTHKDVSGRLLGRKIVGIKETSFDVSAEMNPIYGTQQGPLDFTDGKRTGTFSMTVWREDYEKIVEPALLSASPNDPLRARGSFMYRATDPTGATPASSIEIRFRGVTKFGSGSSDGSDGHEVPLEFAVLDILKNGRSLLNPKADNA